MTRLLEIPLDELGALEPSQPRASDQFRLVKGYVETPEAAPIVPIAVELEQGKSAYALFQAYTPLWRRVRGGEKAVHDPNSRLSRRYGEAASVVQNRAERKLSKEFINYQWALGVLAASEAMRRNGENEADIELARIRLQAELHSSK